jgi:hypothetical protein
MSFDANNRAKATCDEQLAARLGRLRRIGTPEGLREKLVAAVPTTSIAPAGPQTPWCWRAAAKWIGASIAAGIALATALWLAPLIGPNAVSVADINDRSTTILAADVNAPDANAGGISDHNSL